MNIGSREICKACWDINRIGFSVPDEVWGGAVPERLQGGVLCLSCFTRFADERMIAWDTDITFHPVGMATHYRSNCGGASHA